MGILYLRLLSKTIFFGLYSYWTRVGNVILTGTKCYITYWANMTYSNLLQWTSILWVILSIGSDASRRLSTASSSPYFIIKYIKYKLQTILFRLYLKFIIQGANTSVWLKLNRHNWMVLPDTGITQTNAPICRQFFVVHLLHQRYQRLELGQATLG